MQRWHPIHAASWIHAHMPGVHEAPAQGQWRCTALHTCQPASPLTACLSLLLWALHGRAVKQLIVVHPERALHRARRAAAAAHLRSGCNMQIVRHDNSGSTTALLSAEQAVRRKSTGPREKHARQMNICWHQCKAYRKASSSIRAPHSRQISMQCFWHCVNHCEWVFR